MSAAPSIGTSTGQHAVDPYKTQNFEDPPLPQKIEELVDFISEVKFGMLTTKQSDGEYLASRCMALTAQVNTIPMLTATDPQYIQSGAVYLQYLHWNRNMAA